MEDWRLVKCAVLEKEGLKIGVGGSSFVIVLFNYKYSQINFISPRLVPAIFRTKFEFRKMMKVYFWLKLKIQWKTDAFAPPRLTTPSRQTSKKQANFAVVGVLANHQFFEKKSMKARPSVSAYIKLIPTFAAE